MPPSLSLTLCRPEKKKKKKRKKSTKREKLWFKKFVIGLNGVWNVKFESLAEVRENEKLLASTIQMENNCHSSFFNLILFAFYSNSLFALSIFLFRENKKWEWNGCGDAERVGRLNFIIANWSANDEQKH